MDRVLKMMAGNCGTSGIKQIEKLRHQIKKPSRVTPNNVRASKLKLNQLVII
jgi:hypothetical protein